MTRGKGARQRADFRSVPKERLRKSSTFGRIVRAAGPRAKLLLLFLSFLPKKQKSKLAGIELVKQYKNQDKDY